jgi:hypothetical protein
MNEKELKGFLFKCFYEGNNYAKMPEDDYDIVKEDFETWYSEVNKNDLLPDVSKRETFSKRELLNDFLSLVNVNDCVFDTHEEQDDVIDRYLKGNL